MIFKRNWAKILRDSWSMRLVYLYSFLTVLEMIFPTIVEYLNISEGTYHILNVGVLAFVPLARILIQNELSESSSDDEPSKTEENKNDEQGI